VDNGKFVTLDVGDNYVVHGQKLTKLDRVLGTYKNGNKKLIPATDYTIESENVAKLGLEYKANVSLISDPTNKIEVKAHVLSQVNAKNFVCENITQKTKDVESYVIEDGKFVSTGLITVNNGGFKTKYAEYKPSTRKSLKTTYVANAHTDGDLWIRCGNYNWDGTIKAYYWGNSSETVSWPGVEMTYTGTDANGYALYETPSRSYPRRCYISWNCFHHNA